MTQPPYAPPPAGGYGQVPPPPPPQGNDNSALLGGIGIPVGLICCWPAGLILGILSIRKAKEHGSSTTLGVLAIVASVVNVIIAIILSASGALSNLSG